MRHQTPPPDVTIFEGFDFNLALAQAEGQSIVKAKPCRSSQTESRPHIGISQPIRDTSILSTSSRQRRTGEQSSAPLSDTAVLNLLSQTTAFRQTTPARPIVFNRERALDRLGGMVELLTDVMRLIQSESPKVHSQIHRTLAERDATELKRSAHTLKGTASIVGAEDLVKRLARIEQLAVEHNFESVGIELTEIDRQFEDMQAAVSRELQRQV
jgi:HPt (histidine-containing phosphotransfer) domain-containing protein